MYVVSDNQIPQGDAWLRKAKMEGYHWLAGKDAFGDHVAGCCSAQNSQGL